MTTSRASARAGGSDLRPQRVRGCGLHPRRSVQAGLALALTAICAPALAEDPPPRPLAGAADAGYPRSSDELPPSLPAPEGFGEENDDGTVYDTNWIFTAARGDADTIWFQVFAATILGTAHVSSDDSDDTSRLTKSAYGEEHVTFSVPESESGDTVIHVVNDIAMRARWTLDGRGSHSLYLSAVAKDIGGGRHEMLVQQATSVPTKVQTTTVVEGSLERSSSASVSLSEDASASAQESSDLNALVRTWTSASSSSSPSSTGSSEYTASVRRSVPGRSAGAVVASTETATISTQSMSDDFETYVEVQQFDTNNSVSAGYTVVPSPSGPGTPGGHTGGGTGTPGGDPGAPPMPPGGGGGGVTTPGGGGSTPTPGEGSGVPPGDGPTPPQEPQQPQEPEEPQEPALPGAPQEPVPPPGTDLSGAGSTFGAGSRGTGRDGVRREFGAPAPADAVVGRTRPDHGGIQPRT